MNRRDVFFGSASAAAIGVLALALRPGAAPLQAAEGTFEVTMTDDEWKKKLSPDAYNVLRQQGTEYPGTSPLLNEHRVGMFSCAGCDLTNFDSKTKFDSGTGWPSFFDVLPNAVIKSTDNSLGMTRDEIHCRRCGGHLGHVFDDGPQPTGLRYCMNGVALKFTPAAT